MEVIFTFTLTTYKHPSMAFELVLQVMTVDEWSARWKRNDDFPECLKCGSSNTKEHHFTQVNRSGMIPAPVS